MEVLTSTPIQAGIGLAALLALVVHSHWKTFSFWSSRGINGPRPWPYVGTNIYYFFRHKLDVERDWFKRYGKVYGTYEGYRPVLKIADAELIKHVWVGNFSHFSERNGVQVYSPHMKRWLLWTRADRWLRLRALMTPLFTGSKMRAMFASMTTCMRRFLNELGTRIKDSRSKIVCSRDEFLSLTLDVLATSIFSLKLNTYQDKSSQFYRRAFAFSSFDQSWFILWALIPTPIAKYFKVDLTKYSQYKYFDKLSQRIIDDRRNHEEIDPRKNDFIQTLLDAEIPSSGLTLFNEEDDALSHYNAQMTHKQLTASGMNIVKDLELHKMEVIDIRAQMSFLFVAGFEATSSTLTFCFYQLAHQEQLQQELAEEISNTLVCKKSHRELDYTDLVELKKLDAFLSEILRMYPPVTEVNRRVTWINGVTLPTSPPIYLPEGTAVATSANIVHRDPEYWPNPDEFDMSRFYAENRDRMVGGSYLPFGMGPRNCAGMRFALTVIKMALATTLLKYRVYRSDKTQEYPAKHFAKHSFFLQLQRTEYALEARDYPLHEEA